jgi:MoaA/NifB/PqqE/SkfB family radical SAM enzyme
MAVEFDILRAYNASRQCVDKGSICHAPENSMYFGSDGVVSACCYSRSSALGRYPQQSIEEIWLGAQVKSMRAALRRNEFPGGCELCADQLNARNFSGFLAHGFDSNARPLRARLISRARAFLQPGGAQRHPARFEFELSNKCNLECSMCSGFHSSSIRANRENLPPLPQVYDKAFVQQLLPFLPHLTKAKFLGGEPFLVDLYYEIWDRLIEINPKCVVSITTNGTVFTGKVKRVLEKLNCEVIVSLDSVTKATYESIRRNASLERTLSNLQAFSDINRLKRKSLMLAICPMTSNCREIPGLVAFANERGMRIFFNTVVFPADHSIMTLPLEVQRELVDLYRKSNPQPQTEIESANFKAIEGLCRQIKFWMKEEPSAARPPLEQRCAELLANRGESGSVACVLSDLAGDNVGTGAGFVHIEGADPVHELKAYCLAVCTVGCLLQSSGLLADLRFDQDDLQVLLRYLDRSVSPQKARRIQFELRRFPKQTLRYCGTFSAERLIELLDASSL